MKWLTTSEALVWKKLYEKHKEEETTIKQIRREVRVRALKKKLFNIVKKGWLVRVNKGRYYVPDFNDIAADKIIIVHSLEEVREQSRKIPLAVGLPANSEMYWYPIRKQQTLYAFKRHHHLIKTRYALRPLKKEVFERSVDVDGVRMLSLEDTIIESLLDRDAQTAMAMAHRLKEIVDWSYLIRRVHEEHVEEMAYVSMEQFPKAKKLKKYYHAGIPRLSKEFIKKALKENTVYAMKHN